MTWLKRDSELDEPIDKLLEELRAYDPNSTEFAAAMEHLETLTKMRAEEHRFPVSPETMALVVGNLVGILIIVGYEQKHVVTSKAMTMLNRPSS
jgi:hypothetical protein